MDDCSDVSWLVCPFFSFRCLAIFAWWTPVTSRFFRPDGSPLASLGKAKNSADWSGVLMGVVFYWPLNYRYATIKANRNGSWISSIIGVRWFLHVLTINILSFGVCVFVCVSQYVSTFVSISLHFLAVHVHRYVRHLQTVWNWIINYHLKWRIPQWPHGGEPLYFRSRSQCLACLAPSGLAPCATWEWMLRRRCGVSGCWNGEMERW